MDRLYEDVTAGDEGSALDLLADEPEDGEAGEDEAGGEGAVVRAAAVRAFEAAGRGWDGLAPEARLALSPRPYQEDALAAWIEGRGRGVVVLPTGAGKTVLALMAIARAGVRPLIVVPTLE